jgi:hypothetical protein
MKKGTTFPKKLETFHSNQAVYYYNKIPVNTLSFIEILINICAYLQAHHKEGHMG